MLEPRRLNVSQRNFHPASRRRPSGLRRWVSVFLLLMLGTFLAASSADRCDAGGHSEPQHILCLDDCAPALIPAPPVAPPADPMPRLVYAETVIRPILSLEREPEKEPPRS